MGILASKRAFGTHRFEGLVGCLWKTLSIEMWTLRGALIVREVISTQAAICRTVDVAWNIFDGCSDILTIVALCGSQSLPQ